mmetsp:Transcript_21679/g.39770  ORF Transcript_21679/g.39770 Transcript_21679/m.39770 type:complete len:955 (+) Transcript_21679:92-2956(+)
MSMVTAVVRGKVLELYGPSTPAVKQAADSALRDFLNEAAAWNVSKELMADTDPTVQFFAAQTLYSKVQRVARGFEALGDAELLPLVSWLQGQLASAALAFQAKQRLSLALAALAVHLCRSHWTTCVEDLLRIVTMDPRLGWNALLAIPEQLSAVVHTYVKSDVRTVALLRQKGLLVATALSCEPQDAEEAVTGMSTDSAFSLAIQTLVQWSEVLGLPLVAEEGFAAKVVTLLQSKAGRSEALVELLLEVLRNSEGAYLVYDGKQVLSPSLSVILMAVSENIKTLLTVVKPMEAMNPAPPLGTADAAMLERWSRVGKHLVEGYTQVLWTEAAVGQVLIAFLRACCMIHPEVAASMSELWVVLKEMHHDSKLPPGVLQGLIRELGAPMVVAMTRFGRLDTKTAYDESSLVKRRESMKDILVDMYCVAVAAAEGPWVLSLLQEGLEVAEKSQDACGIEVLWFAFNGIAEALADEPTIPVVFQTVLPSVFRSSMTSPEHCTTAALLLRSCGPHFQKDLRAHVPSAAQWLVERVAAVPEVASEAVQELCGYAGEALLQHVSGFLQHITTVAPKVSLTVDVNLHGALAGIIRVLIREEAVAGFCKILDPTRTSAKQGLCVERADMRDLLNRCMCRLMRCTSVMEQPLAVEADASASAAAKKTAATALAKVMLDMWPSMREPCQKLVAMAPVRKDVPKAQAVFEGSDEALQVNVFAFLRLMATTANESLDGSLELAQYVCDFAVSMQGVNQLACLSAVSVLAANAENARICVLPLLPRFCSSASVQLQGGAGSADFIPFFLDLLASIAGSVGEHLFQVQEAAQLRQLCVAVLASQEQDMLLRPSIRFLEKLMMSRVAQAGVQHPQEVIESTLMNFHKWPRSVGALMWKLFSACIERHGALLSQLVSTTSMPSIAILPEAERVLAMQCLVGLRGPRLKAFLVDLGCVARRETDIDVLHRYTV